MATDEETEFVVDNATKILKSFVESDIEPVIAFAILANAFSRLAAGLGHTKKSFKNLCNKMAELGEWEKD